MWHRSYWQWAIDMVNWLSVPPRWIVLMFALAALAFFMFRMLEGRDSGSDTIWPDRLTPDFCEELVEAAGDLEEIRLSFDECAYATAFSGEAPFVEAKIAIDIVVSEKCPDYEEELRAARRREFDAWLGQ